MSLSTIKKNNKVYLKDYTTPNYLIPKLKLDFKIESDQKIIVTNTLTVTPNTTQTESPLKLNGDASFLTLKSIKINNQPIAIKTPVNNILTLDTYNTETEIVIITEFNPNQNLALEGIYNSDHILCSQNEPQGFRRITYFMDRPDIMSCYTVSITADPKQYPILLANGNKISETTTKNGQLQVIWEDPFPKPCYLFAFVAGKLEKVTDTFITQSKRQVQLEIYVNPGNENYTEFAMNALKKSMKWDETHYGREYDLDLYMIVAVDSFNMGAMENKGLNIFNTQYVLGDYKTATDQDIQGIDRVIAHEYFHNWTGNRITLRDWFQLTLKEGLTVFRDQQYTADQHHPALKRVHDVTLLRNHQFIEDAGPMAHPIRPDSFVEINNFYTVTVYEKGAEIIRLYHTLLGPETYRKAMDRYFNIYDGKAITTEDFQEVMANTSGQNLSQFENWYSQSGTPTVTISSTFKTNTLIITATQTGTPKPVIIPIRIGLLSEKGNPLSFQLSQESTPTSETILTLTSTKSSWTLYGINNTTKPIISSFRGFSAPVYYNKTYLKSEKYCIFQYDTDLFNRWDAGQELYTEWIQQVSQNIIQKQPIARETELHNIISTILKNYHTDPAFTASLITLPGLATLLEGSPTYDVNTGVTAKEMVLNQIISQHETALEECYTTLYKTKTKAITVTAMDQRQLQNLCLYYLNQLNHEKYQQLAYTQFSQALTMTDQLAALKALCVTQNNLSEQALSEFHQQWHARPLLMNKWFAIQVSIQTENALNIIQTLEKHPDFDIKNPNKIRALYGTFAANLKWFHQESGDGYIFLANKVIEIDSFNPSMASRLASAFKKYHQLLPNNHAKMKIALELINNQATLSKNTREIISKTYNKNEK